MTRTTERLVLRPDGQERVTCYYAVTREDWEKEVRRG